jgi:hypothetical protein
LKWHINASMKNIEWQHHGCNYLENNIWQHNRLQKGMKSPSAATSCSEDLQSDMKQPTL